MQLYLSKTLFMFKVILEVCLTLLFSLPCFLRLSFSFALSVSAPPFLSLSLSFCLCSPFFLSLSVCLCFPFFSLSLSLLPLFSLSLSLCLSLLPLFSLSLSVCLCSPFLSVSLSVSELMTLLNMAQNNPALFQMLSQGRNLTKQLERLSRLKELMELSEDQLREKQLEDWTSWLTLYRYASEHSDWSMGVARGAHRKRRLLSPVLILLRASDSQVLCQAFFLPSHCIAPAPDK